MTPEEIGELITQIQTSLGEKLENILQQMKNNLEPQGKWTPDLEEKLRRSIKLSK